MEVARCPECGANIGGQGKRSEVVAEGVWQNNARIDVLADKWRKG